MSNIKIYNSGVSCGLTTWESPAAEYSELSVTLDNLIINNPNSTYLAFASGDSMNGYGIYNGDLLIVDRKPEPRSGSIVIVFLNGSMLCKKLDKERRCLLSANDCQEPIYISEDDDFSVEGTLIRSIRLFTPLEGV